MTTDEELERKRQRIAELRSSITEAEDEKARAIYEADNAVENKLLDREVYRLESQLAFIKGEPGPVAPPTLDGGDDTQVVAPNPAPASHQTPTPPRVISGVDTQDEE